MASKKIQDFVSGVVTSSGALTGSSDDGQKTKIDPISAISLITTFIPILLDGLKKCRSLKKDLKRLLFLPGFQPKCQD